MEEHRLHKYKALKEKGIAPYVNHFKDNEDVGDIVSLFSPFSPEELEAKKDSRTIAGRVMGIRAFGKVSFFTLKDRTASLQVYVKAGVLDPAGLELFALCEAGDFVSVSGYIFRTRTGELTICAEKLTLLTKALHDLPEKWHGLKDVEKRHRMRYLDLIANTLSLETFKKRSRIVRAVREFFYSKGFLEVETPMMHQIAGGAAAKPFTTHHNALNMDLYLRIAPELYLKRLVVGGIERVFELNRNFRNEGLSVRHNPEFTMVEWYMAYNDYHGLMDMVEELFVNTAQEINGKAAGYFEEDGNVSEIDLSPPWPRLTVREAVLRYAEVSPVVLESRDTLRAYFRAGGHKTEESWGYGKLLMELFETKAEHKLIKPTFIIDYPKEVSPLAKSKKEDPDTTERFEMFVGGIELVNGFNELNDPFDQRERFEKQMADRAKGDEEAQMMDKDYLHALEYGMPPTAGAGLGIDRFVMLLCGKRNIREVILFPHMRPEE